MLALGRLFEDQNLGAEIMGSDGGGETGRAEPDDNDIRLGIPMVVRGARHARFVLHHTILSIAEMPGNTGRF